MTTERKDYLIALLNFSNKLKSGDSTITKEIDIINSFSMTDEDTDALREVVMRAIESSKSINFDFIQNSINTLNINDKIFFEKFIEMLILERRFKIDHNVDISEGLNNLLDETITFENPSNETRFYRYLVAVVLRVNNVELIEKCVNKLSSI